MGSKLERYLCPFVWKVIPRTLTFVGRIERRQVKNALCACGWKPVNLPEIPLMPLLLFAPQGAAVDNLSKSDQEARMPRR